MDRWRDDVRARELGLPTEVMPDGMAMAFGYPNRGLAADAGLVRHIPWFILIIIPGYRRWCANIWPIVGRHSACADAIVDDLPVGDPIVVVICSVIPRVNCGASL